jgi:hypothetical protein
MIAVARGLVVHSCEVGGRSGRVGGQGGGVETWNELVARAAARNGVTTPADARAAGVPESTWRRRTQAEGWARPFRGVRVAPWASRDPRVELASVLAACPPGAAASGRTAAWLQGLDEPRVAFDVVVPEPRRAPDLGRHRARRSRWLEDTDVRLVDGIACLTVPATLVSRAGEPLHRLRAYVVDAVHRGQAELDDIAARVGEVPSLPGRAALVAMLGDLAGRAPESTFHDLVLTDLLARGYAVERAPRPVPTPDGRGVLCDVALPDFLVAIEPEGDRWHRTRRQRRSDRRRAGQYAATDWAVVPIDWQDWHERRAWVLETIDAAILAQLRRGHGGRELLPPHLRGRA